MSQHGLVRIRLTRSAVLAGYGDVARALGLDPLRMLAAAGLPMASLADPDLRVAFDAVEQLLEASASRARVCDFGMRMAEARSLANLGPLGLVAREQSTLRGAIEMVAQHIGAHSEALSLRIENAGAVAILHAMILRDVSEPGVQSIEMLVAAMVRMLRRLTGGAFSPESVHFRHPTPPNIATHRRVLGLTPIFSATFDGVVLDTATLGTVVPQADPVAAMQLERHIPDWAGDRRDDPAGAVHELLILLLPAGNASIDRVALHLGMTRRTLHRHLAAHGTSFTRILEETRRELVANYCRDDKRSLTEIAGLVGYSSLSAFSRWRRG